MESIGFWDGPVSGDSNGTIAAVAIAFAGLGALEAVLPENYLSTDFFGGYAVSFLRTAGRDWLDRLANMDEHARRK
jgi:hypothetical protein